MVHCQSALIFVHQAEGWTGDVAIDWHIQPYPDELGNGGLARTEGTSEDDYITWFGDFTQQLAETFGVGQLFELDFEAFRGHSVVKC